MLFCFQVGVSAVSLADKWKMFCDIIYKHQIEVICTRKDLCMRSNVTIAWDSIILNLSAKMYHLSSCLLCNQDTRINCKCLECVFCLCFSIVTWAVIWKELKHVLFSLEEFKSKTESFFCPRKLCDCTTQLRSISELQKKSFYWFEKLPDTRQYLTGFIPSVCHSLFHLRNDFLDNHQSLIVIIKLQLHSDE